VRRSRSAATDPRGEIGPLDREEHPLLEPQHDDLSVQCATDYCEDSGCRNIALFAVGRELQGKHLGWLAEFEAPFAADQLLTTSDPTPL
jgi:hypothetical protein